ncbi:hypothetical protein [Subdoligranulum variabile]|uniref:hypothetical protein n=1 Tax=Subdoligranulum variabile TaxID=214851 RepID=UPI0026F167A6|nr:hypothetical protein [Subdoligranulum variabile]
MILPQNRTSINSILAGSGGTFFAKAERRLRFSSPSFAKCRKMPSIKTQFYVKNFVILQFAPPFAHFTPAPVFPARPAV